MSRLTVGRIACGLALVLFLGLCAAWAQEKVRSENTVQSQPAKGDDGAKNKRTFYIVKHGSAKELAATLAKHFKGDAEVQALPDSPSNCLLISAAPAVFEEVVKLLDQLDRRPQLISIEVLVAEVPPKKGEDGKPAPAELDEKEFTGPSNEVVAKLEALRKKGQIGSLKRIQLTAVENQLASVQIGENKPVVAGVNVSSTGIAIRNIMYRNTGTQVRLTPRVTPEKAIALDLRVDDARLHVPEDGIPIGKDEKGMPILATEFIDARLEAKLSVPSGKAVAALGVKTNSKSGNAQTLIVVTARVVEPDK